MYWLGLLIEVVQARITNNFLGFVSDAFKHPFDCTGFLITFFTRMIIIERNTWRQVHP